MEQEIVHRSSIEKLENRMSSVEDTLKEILVNTEEMDVKINEKLVDIGDEIVRNTAQVRKLKSQLNNNRYKPATIFFGILLSLTVWTICLFWVRS